VCSVRHMVLIHDKDIYERMTEGVRK
jgi:hypothetical protein